MLANILAYVPSRLFNYLRDVYAIHSLFMV
jgi:hypothetical protein